MSLSPPEIVRTLLMHAPGGALCDSCLALACGTSVTEMRQITGQLAIEDPGIERGATCASCGRTVVAIRYRADVPKCAYCSRPLGEGEEASVTIDGDRFHDGCLRRLLTDETVRMSSTLNRRSQELIEESRRRMRAGQVWPDLDDMTD